tara:strand:+ start:275 stop:523 length:249 start_codon:yes stop_codon:yes gene_type:complete
MIKTLFCIIILFCISSVNANAKIVTKEQADSFLARYCIELVNVIETQFQEQLILAKREKWQEFIQKGTIIAEAADVYSKLCK